MSCLPCKLHKLCHVAVASPCCRCLTSVNQRQTGKAELTYSPLRIIKVWMCSRSKQRRRRSEADSAQSQMTSSGSTNQACLVINLRSRGRPRQQPDSLQILHFLYEIVHPLFYPQGWFIAFCYLTVSPFFYFLRLVERQKTNQALFWMS